MTIDARQDTRPNFLIVGAAKSGTTSLYEYLSQHPDVFMPPNLKEPHYFCYKDTIVDFRGPGKRYPSINKSAITSLDAYLDLFLGSEGYIARGEASATYLYWPQSASNIAAFNPDMKIIITLRNPVDRAYSAYNHLKRLGLEPVHSLQEAMDLEEERIKANYGPMWRYAAMGQYAEQVEAFRKHFPDDQIKILIFEDFVRDKAQHIKDILDFLGVNSAIEVDLEKVSNESFVPDEGKIFHRVLASENFAKNIVRSLLPKKQKERLAHAVRKTFFKKPDKLVKESRSAIYTKNFSDTVASLEEVLGRPLDLWKYT